MRASNRTTDAVEPTPEPPTAPQLDALVGGGSDQPTRYVEPPDGMLDPSRSHPISEVVYRRRAQVGGKVRSVRVRPWGEVLTFELVLADQTGALTVAFLGRRSLAGVKLGTWLTVEGMVGARDGKLLMLNPAYDLRPLDDRM